MKTLGHKWISTGLLMVCTLLGTGLSLLWAPSAQAVLPPRPTVNAPSSDDHDVPTPRPTVTLLYLSLTPADQTYWSVVQWQDAEGAWHDVEGWRGDVTHGEIMWWVAEKDFGTGPFRWAIYPPGGPFLERVEGNTIYRKAQPLLALSQPFYLPTGSSSSLGIYITVPTHKQ